MERIEYEKIYHSDLPSELPLEHTAQRERFLALIFQTHCSLIIDSDQRISFLYLKENVLEEILQNQGGMYNFVE